MTRKARQHARDGRDVVQARGEAEPPGPPSPRYRPHHRCAEQRAEPGRGGAHPMLRPPRLAHHAHEGDDEDEGGEGESRARNEQLARFAGVGELGLPGREQSAPEGGREGSGSFADHAAVGGTRHVGGNGRVYDPVEVRQERDLPSRRHSTPPVTVRARDETTRPHSALRRMGPLTDRVRFELTVRFPVYTLSRRLCPESTSALHRPGQWQRRRSAPLRPTVHEPALVTACGPGSRGSRRSRHSTGCGGSSCPDHSLRVHCPRPGCTCPCPCPCLGPFCPRSR